MTNAIRCGHRKNESRQNVRQNVRQDMIDTKCYIKIIRQNCLIKIIRRHSLTKIFDNINGRQNMSDKLTKLFDKKSCRAIRYLICSTVSLLDPLKIRRRSVNDVFLSFLFTKMRFLFNIRRIDYRAVRHRISDLG